MDRLALTGLVLAVAGAAGLLSLELIGTAHAGRAEDKLYLVAISSGSALHLAARAAEHGGPGFYAGAQPVAIGAEVRRLSCARMVEVSLVSLGFRCRAG